MANEIGLLASIDVTKINDALKSIDKGVEKIATSMDTMVRNMEKGFSKVGESAVNAGKKAKEAFDPNAFTSVDKAIVSLNDSYKKGVIGTTTYIQELQKLGINLRNVSDQANLTGTKIRTQPSLTPLQVTQTQNLNYQGGLNIPQLNQSITILENYRNKLGLVGQSEQQATDLLARYKAELQSKNKTTLDAAQAEAKLAAAIRKEKDAAKISTYDGAMGMSSKTIDERIAKLNALRAVRAKTSDGDTDGANKIKNLNQEMYRLDGANKRAISSGIQVERQSDKMKNTIEALTRRVAYYASFNMFANFIKQLATVRGEFELQQRSLEAIIRNKDAANKIFTQIQTLAVVSPFQFKELLSYTKQLAAFRIETSKLYDTTKMLADVSAGLGVDMSRLILAYGQVKSASVLRGQELRQFTEAGIPLVQELADKFSLLEGRTISTGEVFEKISKRMVSFEMVDEIFKKMTESGGMFYNMQEIQAETVKGKMSNLIDSYQIMLNKMGTEQQGAIKLALNSVTLLMNNYQVLIDILLAVAGGYGVLTVKSLLMKLAIGQETMSLEKEIISAKRKRASDLMALALTQELTAAENELIATRNTLTAADKTKLVIDNQFNKNQALRLLYFGKLDKTQQLLLANENGLTKEQILSYQQTSKMGQMFIKVGFLGKAAFRGIGMAISGLFSASNIVMGSLMVIGTVIAKIISAHREWDAMLNNIAKSAMEMAEGIANSYKDVADVIQKGVDETNKQKLGQTFDETSITRAIIAIQSLGTGNEVLNKLIQTRIGYYKNESEKLIAMKKLLDDYMAAAENSKKNPKDFAIAADTGSAFNEGWVTDMNQVGAAADDLTAAFVKFKQNAGSALDSYKEKFATLKEDGLSYAETIKFINELYAESNKIVLDPNSSTAQIYNASKFTFSVTALRDQLNEGQAEYKKFWDNLVAGQNMYNGKMLKYGEDYYGLTADEFKSFTGERLVDFENWLKNQDDATKANGAIFLRQLTDQFDSADKIYKKAFVNETRFLDDTKKIYRTFNGQIVDYSNKTTFGLSSENREKFKTEMQKLYEIWMQRQDSATQNMSYRLDQIFNRTYTVKFDFIHTMQSQAGGEALDNLNVKLSQLNILYGTKIPNFALETGKGIESVFSELTTLRTEADKELERLNNSTNPADKTEANIKKAKAYAAIYKTLSDYEGLDNKKATAAANKEESIYLKQLKTKLKLIEDVQKAYSDLEKLGYGKNAIPSLMPENYNKELEASFGKGMDVTKIAEMSKKEQIALFEKIKTKFNRTDTTREVNLQIAKLKIDVSQEVIDKASEDLNNSLSNIQDGLTLSKDLQGFDSELREAFKKTFDYKELNIDQALSQLQDSINKELKAIGENGIDMSTMNLSTVLSKTGIKSDSKVGADLKKAYEARTKILQDDMKTTADNYKKLLDKYADYDSKQVTLTLNKNQEIYDLNRKFNTDDLQKTNEYVTLKAAIERKYNEESAKLKVEEFKNSELWTKSFEDLDRISTTTLDSLMSKLSEMIRVSGAALDPKDLKELMTAYKKLRTQLEGKNPFKTLASGVKEYKEEREKQKKIDEEILILQAKIALGVQDSIDENGNVVDGTNDYKKAQEDLTKAQGDSIDAGDNVANASKKIISSYEKISKVAKEATEVMSGIVAATMKADSASAEIANDVLNTVNGVADMGTGVAQILAGDVAGGIMSIAKGAWATVSTWIDNSNNNINRSVEESKQTIQQLSNAYDQLQRAIDNAFGAAEIKAKKAAIANLKLQKTEVDKQLALEKSRSGKNKDEDAITALEKQSQDLSNQILDDTQAIVDGLMNGDLKSNVESFSDTVVEAMSSATDSVDALNKSWADMIKEMIKSQFIAPIIAKYIKLAQDEVQGYIDNDDKITTGEIENFASKVRGWSEAMAQDVSQFQPLVDIASDLANGASQTSTLQKGIQSISEQTAQALEGLLNTIRFEVFNHTNLLTNISDSMETSNIIASNLLTVAREGFNLMKEMRLWQDSITWTGHNRGGGKGLKVFGYNSAATY